MGPEESVDTSLHLKLFLLPHGDTLDNCTTQGNRISALFCLCCSFSSGMGGVGPPSPPRPCSPELWEPGWQVLGLPRPTECCLPGFSLQISQP